MSVGLIVIPRSVFCKGGCVCGGLGINSYTKMGRGGGGGLKNRTT